MFQEVGIGKTYVQLLIVAGALLARSLELLTHLGDILVRLGEFGGWHRDLFLS
jgi:hypothetical protein